MTDSTASSPERDRWLRPELIAPWWEIALVLAVMLGPFAWSSVHHALHARPNTFIQKLITDRGLLINTATEAGLLSVFLFYLRWRGWTPADFKLRMNWTGTLAAPFIAIAAGAVNVGVGVTLKILVILSAPHPDGLAKALIADSPHIPLHSIDISWATIIVGSTVNAFLEELVFVGYAFNQFAARRNVLFALLMMAFLRMLLHTYKGPLEMLGIGAFSLAYGLAYVYLRRLWPLVLAHDLTDLAAFSAFKIMFGR